MWNRHVALLLQRCMQKGSLYINGMKVKKSVVCDGHENTNSIESDSWCKSAVIVNAKLLTEPLSNQTSLVLLEHPIGIVLPHKDPLALDHIRFRWQRSILPHLKTAANVEH